MKTLLLLAGFTAVALLSGCISVEDDEPDGVAVEHTMVIED